MTLKSKQILNALYLILTYPVSLAYGQDATVTMQDLNKRMIEPSVVAGVRVEPSHIESNGLGIKLVIPNGR